MPVADAKVILETLKALLGEAASNRNLTSWFERATGRHYDEYVSRDLAKSEQIEKLLIKLLSQEAEEPGALELFLIEVYRSRPLRQDLRHAIAKLRPRIQDFAKVENARVKVIQRDGPAPRVRPTKDGLGKDFYALVEHQKITNPSIPMVNGRVWAKRLYENLCRVCQIEIDQVAKGTGFLVGPSAVLTNWHVVEDAAPQTIRCRFDYAIDMAGAARDGTIVELADPGIVISSPYWANEKNGLLTPHGAPPDCLDFALLIINRDKLSRPEPRPPLDELPTPEERGFVQMTADPTMPNTGHPLIILQHPQGMPVQAALDTSGAIGWELCDPAGNLYWTDPANTRFRYRTNTMGGSSGSPCFSMDWKLVALHHMGHAGSALVPVTNQGVPIGLIRSKIVEAGLEGYLS